MAKKANGITNYHRPIKVKAAINYYNANRKHGTEKMTMESLGKIVFADTGNNDDYGKVKLSDWNNGRTELATVTRCSIIADQTGYPLCELLENYID